MIVAVLMGGASSEHEVSINSGKNIIKGLFDAGHHPVPVKILRNGMWICANDILENIESIEQFIDIIENPLFPEEVIATLRKLKVDVIFPALHGPYGEDGKIQGFLKTLGIPYVGSELEGAFLSSDKLISKIMYENYGLPTAPYLELHKADSDMIIKTLGLPVVLKAPGQGSSFGIEIIDNPEKLDEAVSRLLLFEGRVMAEKFITGREITCGVLEYPNGTIKALPPTEIIPKVSEYFDFKAKYETGGSDEITPARISDSETKVIQEMAVKAHSVLRMRGFSRTDFILFDGNIVILETNSIPGFTATSLYPQAAKVAGFSFAEIIDHLIKLPLSNE